MLLVAEYLKKNIADILQTVQTICRFLDSHDTLSMDQAQQISFSCAEMALLSLAASDEIEPSDMPAEKMLRHEVASALRQIAIHFLNIQEWENMENIKAYFSTIAKHCAFIKKAVDLPEIKEEVLLPNDELQLVPFSGQTGEEAVAVLAAQNGNENEAAGIRAEIRALRELLTALVFERDNLLHVTCKEIEADYMRELGSLEAEIYHAECEARYLLRKMEMMQASIKRRERIKVQEIDEDLKAQYEEYQKIYEEFVRRIFESAEFQFRRKKKKAESQQSASQESASEEAGDRPKAPESQIDDAEEKKLKKLYRAIVKAMHPDLHPDQDEATKDLFKRAIAAYKDGDLKTLTEIAGMIAGEHEDAADDPVEALLREKARILTLIRNVRAEIHIIKTRFPYTKKAILEDPVRLAEEKAKLQVRMNQAKQQAETYKKRIAEMEKKHG